MTGPRIFDSAKFSRHVRAHRGALGLRTAAEASGVLHTAIDSIERGGGPSLEHFLRLCRWMRVNPGQFVKGGA